MKMLLLFTCILLFTGISLTSALDGFGYDNPTLPKLNPVLPTSTLTINNINSSLNGSFWTTSSGVQAVGDGTKEGAYNLNSTGNFTAGEYLLYVPIDIVYDIQSPTLKINKTTFQDFYNTPMITGTDGVGQSTLVIEGITYFTTTSNGQSDLNNFAFYVANSGGLPAPEVDFNINGVRAMVFGYDSYVGRGIFYNDNIGGGMYFWDGTGISAGTGIALGYDPSDYEGNVFFVENGITRSKQFILQNESMTIVKNLTVGDSPSNIYKAYLGGAKTNISGYFVGNNKFVTLASNNVAGAFDDDTNNCALADGTYALNCYGTSTISKGTNTVNISDEHTGVASSVVTDGVNMKLPFLSIIDDSSVADNFEYKSLTAEGNGYANCGMYQQDDGRCTYYQSNGIGELGMYIDGSNEGINFWDTAGGYNWIGINGANTHIAYNEIFGDTAFWGYILDDSGLASMIPSSRVLYDDSGSFVSVHYGIGILYKAGGSPSIDWKVKRLYRDLSTSISVDYNRSLLMNETSNTIVYNFSRGGDIKVSNVTSGTIYNTDKIFTKDINLSNNFLGKNINITNNLNVGNNITCNSLFTNNVTIYGTQNNVTLINVLQDFRIALTGATAQVKIIPSVNDIYFQNTNSSGNTYFTGLNSATQTGKILFKTTGGMGVGVVSPRAFMDINGSTYINGDTNVTGNLVILSNTTATKINATNTINTQTNFSVNNIQGITKNLTVMKTALTTCTMNFTGGILYQSDC